LIGARIMSGSLLRPYVIIGKTSMGRWLKKILIK
jgi:hypothetical protein